MWTWPSIITGTSASAVRMPAQPDALKTPAAPSAFSARRRERSIVDSFMCFSLWPFFHAGDCVTTCRAPLTLGRREDRHPRGEPLGKTRDRADRHLEEAQQR